MKKGTVKMDSATHQARLPMSRMVKHMPVDSTKRERESKAVGNGKGKGKAGDYQKRAHQGEKTARETKKAKAVPNGAAGTRAAEVGAGAAEEGSEGGRSAARCQDCPFDNNLRPAKGPPREASSRANSAKRPRTPASATTTWSCTIQAPRGFPSSSSGWG